MTTETVSRWHRDLLVRTFGAIGLQTRACHTALRHTCHGQPRSKKRFLQSLAVGDDNAWSLHGMDVNGMK